MESSSLWAVLFAAGSSPSARHRSVSIGVAIAAALRASSGPVPQTTLPTPTARELIDIAAQSAGVGFMHEDFVPDDPTRVVTVRVGDELLQFMPGLTERPIADLSRALRLAEAVDSRLIRRRQFGVLNLVRVCVKYMDFCAKNLLSTWKPVPEIDFEDEVTIPRDELVAAQHFTTLDPTDHLDLNDADIRALEWMTSSLVSAKYQLESPTSPFGRYVRYRNPTTGQPDRWLPPMYIPEILGHATSELISILERDNSAQRALRSSYVQQARRALWRFSSKLIEPPLDGRDENRRLLGSDIHWLLPVNQTTFIAVSIINIDDIPSTGITSFGCLRLAEQIRLDRASPAAVPMVGGQSGTLKPGAQVFPLAIFAGTAHLAAPQQPGCAAVSLEDLTWIAETADSRDDLFQFVKALSSPDLPETFGWETIDYWESWRANGKSLFKGGAQISALFVEPHAGAAEWARALELSPLEVALHGAGLPALRDTQLAEASSGTVANVGVLDVNGEYDRSSGQHEAPDLKGWSISLLTPPVAIVRSDPDWPDEGKARDFLFDTSGGLVFGFAAVRDLWEATHADGQVQGYQLFLDLLPSGEMTSQNRLVTHMPITVNPEIDAQVSGCWKFQLEEFVKEADGRPDAPNKLTADTLFDLLRQGGMPAPQAETLRDAWLNAPPFLIVETKSARTAHNNLPSPWPLNGADESAAVAAFARKLHDAGVKPGQYRGREANDLVKQHLAPAALASLTELISEHDPNSVIVAGMEQLNRVVDSSISQQEDLARVAANLKTTWDPLTSMADSVQEMVQLRQCNQIIVEAALRNQVRKSGNQPINPQRWSAMLAAADAYNSVTTLSEKLHHRVAPETIDISSAYELTLQDGSPYEEEVWPLNAQALSLSNASLRFGKNQNDQSDDSVLEDEVLSSAALETIGATLTDIFYALIASAKWEDFEDGRTAAVTTSDALVDWVCLAIDAKEESERQRISNAISLLTITSDELSSSDWSPWLTRTRRHRLLVQPFVGLSEKEILLAPHYLLASLNVYNNYLTQGMLPWSEAAPKLLEAALAARRAARNSDFERILEQHLENRGFKTISRVKPGDHARLGVPAVSTEIDLVCARPGERVIWLIEAKDPASVYGIAETARQLRTFFRDAESKGRLKPCYATQLARKEAELRPHLGAVAARLEMEGALRGGTYELRTVFVTRNLVPAGFVDERFDVLSMDTFLAAIDETSGGDEAL
ncbi:hypothetical protein [Leucobacter sp. GX24907]